ncbi:YjdF family protein [Desulfosporosinus meridiei]|uniref:YjdF family protein n=1 Tax=Desulfosporosinus meridiei TaxID=79209 RepID=UPI000693D909|nr:YjdF family protein [Desulfosporosinus meridiei]
MKYKFLLHNWFNLKFSLPIVAEKVDERRVNPKRVQKLSKKQVSNNGVGTKAQQALKLQHEEAKLERRRNNREKWKVEEQMKFKLRQKKKRKEKHKGR